MFVETLLDLMRQFPENRNKPLFEITESTQITDLDGVNGAVRRLQEQGCQVCLDDFGAGTASFQYLQAIQVDFVKIDGAYVGRMLTSERDRLLIRNLSQLCHELGVGTIAEFVETHEQADLLNELGVQFGQGYFFGRPDFSANQISDPSKAPINQYFMQIRDFYDPSSGLFSVLTAQS